MYYVYIMRSELRPDQVYTGITKNLQKRIETHNSGGSIHTNKFKPWVLESYVAFSDEGKAKEFEQYLKTGSGKAFRNKRL